MGWSDTNLGVGVHELLSPHPHLILVGYSIRRRNLIGAASGSINTTSGNGGMYPIHFWLSATNQVENQLFGDRGIRCKGGITLTVESGSIDITLFYKVPK